MPGLFWVSRVLLEKQIATSKSSSHGSPIILQACSDITFPRKRRRIYEYSPKNANRLILRSRPSWPTKIEIRNPYQHPHKARLGIPMNVFLTNAGSHSVPCNSFIWLAIRTHFSFSNSSLTAASTETKCSIYRHAKSAQDSNIRKTIHTSVSVTSIAAALSLIYRKFLRLL